jgi:hypothetical protein
MFLVHIAHVSLQDLLIQFELLKPPMAGIKNPPEWVWDLLPPSQNKYNSMIRNLSHKNYNFN